MKASKITKYTAAAALTILLGSCAKVEDSASGTKLIPIELKVSIEPATRSLHTKKSWNPGKDHILVSTYQTNYGDFSFGEYLVIDTEGNTKAIQPAVRKTKEYDYAPQTRIYAFYWPAGSRDKKVNLQDQSTPQLLEAVDILEATPSKGSEDLQPEGVATVSFYHALARIRLVLDNATIDASEVTEVLVASDTEASIGTRWPGGGAILTLEYSNPGGFRCAGTRTNPMCSRLSLHRHRGISIGWAESRLKSDSGIRNRESLLNSPCCSTTPQNWRATRLMNTQ